MRESGFIAPPAPSSDIAFAEAILWAGDIVAELTPIRMSTVLGSCVSVCLFDAGRQIGGMNHYLVPRGGRSAIHGDWATTELIERLCAMGSSPRSLQGKIFGGGSPLRLENEGFAVGRANVVMAREILATEGIPVVAERIEHNGGLRLFFESWTGTAWVRVHTRKESP
jgi:chemotaxis protein CheD